MAYKSRFKHVERIEVYLWGHLVGAAARDPAYGCYAFAYAPQFRARRIEPSPLAMPVTADQTYIFPNLPAQTYRGLPPMLADALPDEFGNALIDKWMAEHGVPKDSITPLDRLAYMSTRAMGAFTFRPARGEDTRSLAAIHLVDLVDAARRAVHGDTNNDAHAQQALRDIIDVGTSAGGRRPKAVIAWNETTGEIRSGHGDAPDGFEQWLLKFDSIENDGRTAPQLGESSDHGRIEYAYYRMASAAGIAMNECRLLEENGRAHFMTKRFDRDANGARHHIQTLCAMSQIDYNMRGTNSYAQLFETMVHLGLTHEDRVEAFRRMAFNVMAANCDDHTKNFAFRLKEGAQWELAPAYDIAFAYNPKGEWTYQHLMSVNGKFKDFTGEDLLADADRFGVAEASHVLQEVADAISLWPHFAAEVGVKPANIAHIQGFLNPLSPPRARALGASRAEYDDEQADERPSGMTR